MIGEVRVARDALLANAQVMRNIAGSARTAFVVKSNAYGHGLLETARALEPLAAMLCVYSLDEAVALRDGGVSRPLLIFGPVPARDLGQAHAVHAAIALWDARGAYARDAAKAAAQSGRRFPVHVKIDTGVTRLGLDPAEAPAAIAAYAGIAELSIDGIFSHLAAAEELDSPFTLQQVARLQHAFDLSVPALGAVPLRHIAASAATMLWPQTRLDLVRVGIALYGLWPSAQTRAAAGALELRPALTWCSTLVSVRDVEPDTPVGYGNAYRTAAAARIGVVPLGYADGIPRMLSNTGAFLVGGVRCPIVGRVCMNMTMLDLSAARDAHAGSIVTLIGRDGDAEVTADEWAAWAETINYEIVSRIRETIPRIFA